MKNLQNSVTAGAENAHHLLDDRNFVISRTCIAFAQLV
jgi:hypothetical protein